MPLIELADIRKTYRISKRPPGLMGALRGAFAREYTEIRALDGISFSIDEGEMVGYIGPNGAGKSTTIKVMSGILVPDSGNCEIAGLVPWKKRRQHVAGIGVVFGQRSQLWWDTPVRDSFELLRDIYAIPHADYVRRLDELVDRLNAASLMHTPVRQLSLGQRMRCELIAALLHDPKLLFLDEPTIGLDAISKLALREFLKERNRQGTTMILTTHDMDDVEALASRVMVIGHGSILFEGDIARLRREFSPQRMLRATLGGAVEELPEIPGVDEVSMEGGVLRVLFRPERIDTQELFSQVSARFRITDMTITDMDIDELVAGMYREMSL